MGKQHFSRRGAAWLLAVLLLSTTLVAQAASPHQVTSTSGQLAGISLVPGSKLTFQSYRDNNWEVYYGNDDGTDLARLTTHIAPDEYPRLNRGATRIVFASTRNEANFNIYVINPDGTGLQQLVFNQADDFAPAWSPDSTRIAFVSKRDGNFEIYRMNADGTAQAKLTADTTEDLDPAWSPDGTRIAFASRRSGSFRIWVMNADGTGQTVLSTQNSSRHPTWSPDGSRIAYDCDNDGDGWQELWVMGADGSSQQLVYDPGPGATNIWAGSWSPDARYIAFTRVNYVWQNDEWVWNSAFLEAWDTLLPGTIVSLINYGLDWYPSWQTTDLLPPTSNVLALPALSPGPFTVSWSGYDNGPAGIKYYDIQVRDGAAGAWTDWLVGTPATSADYPGVGGHTYYFRSRAWDNAYNVEPWPADADTVTTVEDIAPQTAVEELSAFYKGTQILVRWGGLDSGGSGIATYDVQYADMAVGTWTDWLVGTSATQGQFTGVPGHTYAFRCRGTDHALNVEDWPPDWGDTAITFYTWAVGGTARDNRGVLVARPLITTTPGAFLVTYDGEISYTAYISTSASSYEVSCGKAAYGSLPSTILSTGPDSSFDAILPPLENTVLNWGFETGQLGPGDWSASGPPLPSVVSSIFHSGEYAALLGCQGAAFSDPWSVSNTPNETRYPQVAVEDSGSVDVVWLQEEGGSNTEVYYSQRGISGWLIPQNISNTPNEASAPILLVSGGGAVLHTVWTENQGAGNWDVFYTRREGPWASPVNISNNSGASADPRLAVDASGAVHVLWSDNTGGTADIYYARRALDGTWSSPWNISTSPVNSSVPQLAAETSGVLHAVWVEGTDIYYRQRSAGGSWATPYNVSNSASTSTAPRVAVDAGGAAHVVWVEDADIYYARRTSAGSWSSPLNISMNSGASARPQLVVDSGGAVHVIWRDNTPGNQDFYYARRASDGTWSGPQNISDSATNSEYARMALDASGALYVVWSEASDIYFSRRGTDGIWSGPHGISHAGTSAAYPHLAPEASRTAHIVWQENTSGPYSIWHTELASNEQTGDSAISQEVTVPAGTPAATLSFLYHLDGAYPGSGSWLEVQVDDGIVVTTLFSTTSSTTGWTHQWLDLSPWAGQTLTLRLNVHLTEDHVCTWGYLEEVTLGSSYPDIWVDKIAPEQVLPGETLVYTLFYGNQGNVAASSVVVTDTLPAAVSFVAADPAPISPVSPLRWEVGEVPPRGGPYTILVTVTVQPTAPFLSDLINEIRNTTSLAELETDNNQASVATFVGYRVYLPLVLKSFLQ